MNLIPHELIALLSEKIDLSSTDPGQVSRSFSDLYRAYQGPWLTRLRFKRFPTRPTFE